jgi:DNA-binding XRE family transcriptional regulator
MDARKKISVESLKQLREAKSWSQQHLADAAGLSLRTVQRLEADGSASAETRLAVAAALGVPVAELLDAQVQAQPEDLGSTRSAWVVASSGLGGIFVLALGSLLPDTVASHFGASGIPHSYMSREGFVAGMCLLVSALPSLVWWLLGKAAQIGKVNIPNSAYWLSPERRERTAHLLLRHGAWLSVLLSVFMCYTFGVVVAANLAESGPGKLNLALLLPGLVAFIGAIALWQFSLERQLRRGGA